MEESNDTSARAAEWSRVAPVVDEAIDKLSEGDRRLILLRFIERKTFGEIARTFGISEDAARMRNDRALEKIRSELARKGLASTSAVLSATLSANAIAAVPHGLEAAVTGAALAAGSMPLATTGIATALSGVLLSPTIGLVGLMAAALVAAGYEYRQQRTAVADLSVLQGQYQSILQNIRSNERALSARTESPADAPPMGSAAQAPNPPSRPDPRDAGEAFMVRHPEVRTALFQYIDAVNHAKYAPLYLTLGLSPDQIRQFEALVRRGGFGRDLDSGGVITLMAGLTLSPTDRKAGLQVLLGQDGYAQYAAFNDRLPGQMMAANLASLLVATDNPLTVGEARQIADIFSSNSLPGHHDQFDWDRALENARGILNPAEMEMLENLHVQYVGWQQVDSSSP